MSDLPIQNIDLEKLMKSKYIVVLGYKVKVVELGEKTLGGENCILTTIETEKPDEFIAYCLKVGNYTATKIENGKPWKPLRKIPYPLAVAIQTAINQFDPDTSRAYFIGDKEEAYNVFTKDGKFSVLNGELSARSKQVIEDIDGNWDFIFGSLDKVATYHPGEHAFTLKKNKNMQDLINVLTEWYKKNEKTLPDDIKSHRWLYEEAVFHRQPLPDLPVLDELTSDEKYDAILNEDEDNDMEFLAFLEVNSIVKIKFMNTRGQEKWICSV